MSDHASEYLPRNGNGSNGNGNGKIFDLVKHEDPLLSKIVPAVRRRVCEMTRITEGARMLFCYLTDASLLFGTYVRRGVVRFANSYLAVKFNVSEKTIQNWKQALASTGEVWVTEKRMKNSFPMTVYNITAIVGQSQLPLGLDTEDGLIAEDDQFFSNRRAARSLLRGPDGKWQRRTFQADPTPPRGVRPPEVPKIEETAANTEPEEKILPSTTATICRPQRQSIAVHSGKILPSATATNCRGGRQAVAVVDGNPLPLSTANGCRSTRQTVADKGKAQDRDLSQKEDGGGAHPPDFEFEQWVRSFGNDPFRSRLLEAREELKAELNYNSAADKPEIKRRLEWLRSKLVGPRSVTVAPAKPAEVKKALAVVKSHAGVTPEEWLARHVEMMRHKLRDLPHTLTEGNVETLLKAGDAIPPDILKKFPKLVAQLGKAKGKGRRSTVAAIPTLASGPLQAKAEACV